mgnify:CR=1 FL=1
MINIGIKIRPDVGIMSGTWCPIRLIDLELSGTNIFSFFRVFGRFWSILANFNFLSWSKSGGKWCHEKNMFFSKTKRYMWYGHQIWTPYSSWARSNPQSRKIILFLEIKLFPWTVWYSPLRFELKSDLANLDEAELGFFTFLKKRSSFGEKGPVLVRLWTSITFWVFGVRKSSGCLGLSTLRDLFISGIIPMFRWHLGFPIESGRS